MYLLLLENKFSTYIQSLSYKYNAHLGTTKDLMTITDHFISDLTQNKFSFK